MNVSTSLKKIIKGFRLLSLEKRVAEKAFLNFYDDGIYLYHDDPYSSNTTLKVFSSADYQLDKLFKSLLPTLMSDVDYERPNLQVTETWKI